MDDIDARLAPPEATGSLALWPGDATGRARRVRTIEDAVRPRREGGGFVLSPVPGAGAVAIACEHGELLIRHYTNPYREAQALLAGNDVATPVLLTRHGRAGEREALLAADHHWREDLERETRREADC